MSKCISKEEEEREERKKEEAKFERSIESLKSQKNIAAIVSGMKSHAMHAGIQEKACEAFRILAFNADNKVLIDKEGGIPLILAALDNHAKHAGVVEQACRAVVSLTFLLSAKHADVVEYACMALNNIGIHQASTSEEEGPSGVVVTFEEWREERNFIKAQEETAAVCCGLCWKTTSTNLSSEPDDFVCNTACWLPGFSFAGFCWLLFGWILLACWASLIAAFVFVGTSSLPTSLLAPLICVAVGAVCLVCCFCMHITLGLLGLLGFFGHSEDDLPEWCDAWGGVGHAAGVCLLVTALPMLVTSVLVWIVRFDSNESVKPEALELTGWVTAGFHLLALCFVCVVGSFTGAFGSSLLSLCRRLARAGRR